MSEMLADCLIELGTEELPPKALSGLSSAFTDGIVKGLKDRGVETHELESFATPRRIAVLLKQLPLQQPQQRVEKRGPALKAAFDDQGNPSKAAQGFARSCGVDIDQLERRETDKGSWLYFTESRSGAQLAALMPEVVSSALDQLPIPKRMRWGAGDAEFVRPVHWLVMMIGNSVVETELLGIKAGNQTRGHRFHAPEALVIESAAAYPGLLREQGYVLASFAERQQRIRQQVEQLASELGGRVQMDRDLLDEVTALVEWPVAISGRFDEAFLEVPSEALVTTMQDNQKYFAVFDDQGKIMPYFITVANIESREPIRVAEGNERVIRPRFADARFFWQQDRKVPLSARLQSLENVIFQQKLGSVADKVMRVRRLSGWLARQLDASVEQAERAASLCKCDLMTDMVGEFPKLQGIMGRYYAEKDGEDAGVSEAIEQHYWPRFAGDQIPETAIGQCVALADRVDSLVGIFAIGQKPTGVKDPFGLRRAALGMIRILVEKQLSVDLSALFKEAAQALADKVEATEAAQEAFEYLYDRLNAWYQEQGYAFDVIDAVSSLKPVRLVDLDRRIRAVKEFQQHEAAPALAAANKRISNILKKQSETITPSVDSQLFEQQQEHELFSALETAANETEDLIVAEDYLGALNRLALLRDPVDDFFDQVMVMSDQPALKNNRLALLSRLSAAFTRIADFSRLQ